MIASLPMYERAETQAVHARYWQAIREQLRRRGMAAPEQLTRGGLGVSFWTAPDLVLSQTCGLPYRAGLWQQVQLVGTPDMNVAGCPPGHYRSAIVVRADDSRRVLDDYTSGTVAINSTDSQSGYAALWEHMGSSELRFAQHRVSGSHESSAAMVVNGEADIAALDAVSWRFMQRFSAVAPALRVLDWTRPTPSLPYICAVGFDRQQVFDAVSLAVHSLDPDTRDVLGISSLIDISHEHYLAVPMPDSLVSASA